MLINLILEAFTANEERIKDAILNKKVISIYYMGDDENSPGWRTIEPVAYGYKDIKEGKRFYIRAWQQKGKTTTITPGWKFFRTDRIKNWSLMSTQTQNEPRPAYNPNGDKTMDTVLVMAKYDSPDDNIAPRKKPSKKKTPNKPIAKKSARITKKPTGSSQPKPEEKPKKSTQLRKGLGDNDKQTLKEMFYGKTDN